MADLRPHRSGAPTRAFSDRRPAALTTTAWSPCAGLTIEDWARQGQWLGALGRGSGWWIGDWLRYGNARYGERYVAAGQVTGYDVQSLRNMAYVAGRFEVPRRRAALSFSHHAELAGLSPEEQDLWLDRAEVGALSVGSLRSELRRTRHRAASRRALGEARRGRDGEVAAVFPKAVPKGDEVNPPKFAHGATGLGVKKNVFQTIDADVVCPKCGHHFAAGPHPRRQS
jgi:hypothetical protein